MVDLLLELTARAFTATRGQFLLGASVTTRQAQLLNNFRSDNPDPEMIRRPKRRSERIRKKREVAEITSVEPGDLSEFQWYKCATGVDNNVYIFFLISSIKLYFLLFLITDSLQGPHEKRLLNNLLNTYNTLERPVANESESLEVKFGLTLQQIIDVDEKNQILTTNAWLNLDEKNQLLITNIWLSLEWNDYNLRWNDSDFGGVRDLRITPNKLWKPDVLMYNSADEGFDGTYHTNVVVKNNGSCLYVPPGIFKSTCKIDITWFPFDDQHCEMKFGSWTYDGNQLDLVLNSDDGGDLSDFITNGEWYLIGMPGKKNTITYQCCPEPYVDITFTIQIRRRTLYYFFNLIVPCVLISSMALLGFTLPPDSGEKLTLGVTILLSLTVFLNLVAETLPQVSDAIPLLGRTFT
ncbi:neuronal acetylcholine receptor subunit alpha-7-like [Ochlerotatus camptorhynchus]|uniref:neuronal acetylcholine receptor subunit alpha-7-like n=1 Tax=Ochlerotatus camptorhynchus TaxID=644619 RepID=UPI0031D0C02A